MRGIEHERKEEAESGTFVVEAVAESGGGEEEEEDPASASLSSTPQSFAKGREERLQ